MTSPVRELHAAIFAELQGDTDFLGSVKGIHDRIPKESQFPYVSFGPATYVPLDATCIVAGTYTLQVDVWSREVGSGECYDICDAAKRLLHYPDIQLPVNALAMMRVSSVRMFDDPDGLTHHGVLTVEAIIEERT